MTVLYVAFTGIAVLGAGIVGFLIGVEEASALWAGRWMELYPEDEDLVPFPKA